MPEKPVSASSRVKFISLALPSLKLQPVRSGPLACPALGASPVVGVACPYWRLWGNAEGLYWSGPVGAGLCLVA